MQLALRVIANLFNVLAALMFWMGCVWILQGLNILPGSFMTGQIKWAEYGAGMVVVGLAIVVFTNRDRLKV
jgi:hypothetical protein